MESNALEKSTKITMTTQAHTHTYIYIYIGIIGRVFACGPGKQDSIQEKKVVSLVTPRCSSYCKGSLRVALGYRRPTYYIYVHIYIYIYIMRIFVI